MKNVHFQSTVKTDGSFTVPAFAARGLGYLHGERVKISIPTDSCGYGCEDSVLALDRVCNDEDCDQSYTTEGGDINIPIEVFEDAGLPLGGDILVLVSDGMFVIAAAEKDHQSDLTDALSCLMEELGYDPENVERISSALPF
jgi:hypothetical protein